MAVVTIEGEWETALKLLNGTGFNDLTYIHTYTHTYIHT